MFENNTPDFAMYSHLVENNTGRDMAVQSVSYSDLDNVTIPLGINMVQGVQATVSILESNIPEGVTVETPSQTEVVVKGMQHHSDH